MCVEGNHNYTVTSQNYLVHNSGKTYSTLQYLIDICEQYTDLTISVVRETFTALRTTAFRDFEEIMESAELYNPANLRKPQGAYEYVHKGNLIEFFSIQDEQRVRGRKRDILYVNEVNEITPEKWRQLMFRTTGRAVVDFNPSDGEGWFRDEILSRPDCQTLITTYRDNPHLSRWQIEEIERLRESDPEYFNVFGNGQFGKLTGAILAHYQRIPLSRWPQASLQGVDEAYGLDFGFTAPTALVHVKFYDDSHYVRELLYERGLTNTNLIERLKTLIPAEKRRRVPIYCDNAEPDRIVELQRAGFLALPADKNIENGLGVLRSYPLLVTEDSSNLLREIGRYRWKKHKLTNEELDEPVALDDHAIDATRYGVYTHRKLHSTARVRLVNRSR